MRPVYIHLMSILLVIVGLSLIAFIYSTKPRTFAEVATKGTVAIGTYSINKAEFDAGVEAFRKDDFVTARADLALADPEQRDAATQYYIAYSYYRQGWGRLTNDDALFSQGLASVNRVIAIEPSFRSDDADLKMKSPYKLKQELEEGLKFTMSDLNPMRLTRERK